MVVEVVAHKLKRKFNVYVFYFHKFFVFIQNAPGTSGFNNLLHFLLFYLQKYFSQLVRMQTQRILNKSTLYVRINN